MAVKKAVWIRLLIYIPLLAFFGYQAFARFKAGKEAEAQEAASPAPTGDEPTKRTVTLPDGRTVEVYEVTPEQAEMMLGAGGGGEVPDELPPVNKSNEGPDETEPTPEPAPEPTLEQPAEAPADPPTDTAPAEEEPE